MASLRSAEAVASEYEAVRASYLRALNAQGYTDTTATGTRQVQRADLERLKQHMQVLDAEYRALTGEGVTVSRVRPYA